MIPTCTTGDTTRPYQSGFLPNQKPLNSSSWTGKTFSINPGYAPRINLLTKLSRDLRKTYQIINDDFYAKRALAVSSGSSVLNLTRASARVSHSIPHTNRKRKEIDRVASKSLNTGKKSKAVCETNQISQSCRELTEADKQILLFPPLSDYEVLYQLNEGTTSHVYTVQHKTTGTFAAAKIYKGFHKSSLHEINLLKATHSVPHAIKCRDVRRCDADAALILDLIPSNLLQFAGELSFKQVCSIFQQSAEYLKGLKEKGIIHADFKLENMLLNDKTQQVFVCDLGFSYNREERLLASKEPLSLPPSEDVFTTIFNRAPEIFLGYNQFDESIDIYALAISIFELYTGYTLFPVKENSIYFETLNLHLHCMIQQFGMPPADFLKSMKRTELYFQCDPEGNYTLKYPLSMDPADSWQSIMLKTADLNKNRDSVDHVKQLIGLMEKMLRYNDRIKVEDVLDNPLFSQNARFKITLDNPSMRNHTLHIYQRIKLGKCQKLLEIDLSLPETRDSCFHIPRVKGGPIFYIEEHGTNRIKMNQFMSLKDQANLNFKSNRNGMWKIE